MAKKHVAPKANTVKGENSILGEAVNSGVILVTVSVTFSVAQLT